jgi:hypothetical protein
MSWLGHSGIAQVFAAFDKEVPAEFWNEDVESAETVAIVSCPCGEEPHVALLRTEFCPGCDRVFWNLGDRIKVARDPSVTPEPEESSPAGRKLDDGAGDSPNS